MLNLAAKSAPILTPWSGMAAVAAGDGHEALARWRSRRRPGPLPIHIGACVLAAVVPSFVLVGWGRQQVAHNEWITGLVLLSLSAVDVEIGRLEGGVFTNGISQIDIGVRPPGDGLFRQPDEKVKGWRNAGQRQRISSHSKS